LIPPEEHPLTHRPIDTITGLPVIALAYGILIFILKGYRRLAAERICGSILVIQVRGGRLLLQSWRLLYLWERY
jgi:hypothetical protein